MSKCGNCGANAEAGAKFCRGCGFPLSAPAAGGAPSGSSMSTMEIAAGAFKILSGGAEPPKLGGATAVVGILGSYCAPRVA